MTAHKVERKEPPSPGRNKGGHLWDGLIDAAFNDPGVWYAAPRGKVAKASSYTSVRAAVGRRLTEMRTDDTHVYLRFRRRPMTPDTTFEKDHR